MSKDTTTPERKLELLAELGLRKSEKWGETSERVWRPGSNSYYSKMIRQSVSGPPEANETAIRSVKALAAQRNRARRK